MVLDWNFFFFEGEAENTELSQEIIVQNEEKVQLFFFTFDFFFFRDVITCD